ncbi:MAG: hypothetical protein HY682_10815, partial [Chloroflexi bacterium]|nr:hypothetical protein [Chloroflexota bacterium]
MQDLDRDQALKAARDALSAAARELLQRFRRPPGELTGWLKHPGAPVTDADIASDKAIAASLLASGMPGDLVSEESEKRRAGDGLSWLIDPLCGTLPFRQGLGYWGVNIALVRKGDLELGAISIPVDLETLTAVRGGGVTRNVQPYRPSPPRLPLNESTIGVEIDNGLEWPMYAPRVQQWAPSVGAINMF